MNQSETYLLTVNLIKSFLKEYNYPETLQCMTREHQVPEIPEQLENDKGPSLLQLVQDYVDQIPMKQLSLEYVLVYLYYFYLRE